jgi:RNA polymerase sigma-54 factor
MPVQQKPALKLSPKLLLSPAVQQVIKLLQLTRLELEQLLRTELSANPLLELEEDLEEVPELELKEGGDDQQALAEETERANGEAAEEEAPLSTEEMEWAALLANDVHDVPPQHDPSQEEEENNPLFNLPAPAPSLSEELLSQLRLLPVPEKLFPLAEFIIGNLDADGFLRTDLEELGKLLGASAADMEAALSWVQKLEPPGIGARSIQECWLLQLDRMEPQDPRAHALARRIASEGYAELLQQNWQKLAEKLGASQEDIQRALGVLAKLSLHPGSAYGPEEAQAVEPEVRVRKVGGRWKVELVDESLPRIHLSPRYMRLLKSHGQDREALAFLRERLRQAKWLLRAVHQRHQTILRVAEAIVRRQEGFFEEGVAGLRPMVLREIADEVGLHESTVSRVVQNKYMDTPRGLLPFKFFFHSGLSHALAGEVSSVAVKEKIRLLILGEDPKKPLADSRIARLLNRQGIRIARRTVAKYREEMGIPSSEMRKRGQGLRPEP